MAKKKTNRPSKPTEAELAAVRTMTPPMLIELRSERHWTTYDKRVAVAHGIHRFTTIQELSEQTLTGPSYQLVRVISESGAPPANASSAPSCCGCSWAALPGLIADGTYRPL